MSDFLVSPYTLIRGDLIIARVSALNSIGWSSPSPLNTAGVVVQTTPAQPSALIVNTALTDETQITVIMTA